jgi:hypothetical protein
VRSPTGDSVRVTKPVAAVLTAEPCHIAVGMNCRFDGPYPAGTAVALVFTSGSVGSTNVANAHTGVLVSGSYPQRPAATDPIPFRGGLLDAATPSDNCERTLWATSRG